MFATSLFPPAMSRLTSAALAMIQKFLVVFGLTLLVGLIGAHHGHAAFVEGIKSVLPKEALLADEEVQDDVDEPVTALSDVSADLLTPRMSAALDYVSRRYRVSTEALQPIFATAQEVARDQHLDPLLIIAVIGVESGFNPLSQSVFGAQGLMQVVPRFHQDKLPSDAGSLPFFDPLTNVQVGARVLKESIRRNGGLEDGLQQFGGATKDPARRYAGRVLAERQRLELAAQRLRST